MLKMNKKRLFAICIIALLAQSSVSAQYETTDKFPTGKLRNEAYHYHTQAEWDASNFAAPATVKKWQDLRYGMFIHFGLTSKANKELSWGSIVPYLPDPGGMMANGKKRTEEWTTWTKDMALEKFNAKEWVDIAKRSGFKYIVVTTKHHEGFHMWDTEFSDFKITNTPYGRDYLKELTDACHQANMPIGFYFAQREWYHPEYQPVDTNKLKMRGINWTLNPGETSPLGPLHKNYMKFMNNLVRELCTKYGKIDIFWFDALWVGGMFTAEMWDAEHLTRMIRELQPGIIINNRASIPGDFDTPEGRLGAYQDWRAWESCIPLSGGWNYTGEPAHSFEHLLHLIVGSACGDGNLLLSWGPHFDGAFDEGQKQRLFEIGDWLKLNGASIYGTRGGPWKPSNWGGSTRKGNKAFVHIYHTVNNELILPAIPNIKIVSAKLLVGGAAVSFKQRANAIVLKIPKEIKIIGDLVVVLTMNNSLDAVPAINTEHISSVAIDSSTYGKVIFARDKGVQYEPTEWTNVWIPSATKNDLPRVLLIGNSITQSYYSFVEDSLKGRAYVARYTTSRGIQDPALFEEIKNLIKHHKFSVIHFNNGLHGIHYTAAQYEKGLKKLIRTLKKYGQGAELMGATSTRVLPGFNWGKTDEFNQNLIETRNAILTTTCKAQNIPVNDLYHVTKDHPEWFSTDKIHYNESGRRELGKQVVAFIRKKINASLLIGGSTSAVSANSNEEPKKRYIIDMVYNNPGQPPRESKFNNPEYLKALGFNSMVPHWYVQCGITYDLLEKGVVAEISDERQWIDKNAATLKEKIRAAKKAGIEVYPFTDFMVVPKSVWAKFGKQMVGEAFREKAVSGEYHQPDINQEMTKKILRIQIEEIFQTFPELDGLMLRFGETYLHDTPFHLGGSPLNLKGADGIAGHIQMIKLLREEVCVKRNKKLFYRTWDFGNFFHENPAVYRAITDSIEPHQNLIFSVKHVKGDFLRTLAFNPTLSIGNHQQIVEVQCQREYEGKGAYPNYIAKGVIDGFEEYAHLMKSGKPQSLNAIKDSTQFAGVWTWSRGGGWLGPYIKNEFWTELNAFVMAKWAQNTAIPEEMIFRDFARMKGIPEEDISKFRAICLLSEKAVLRGKYSKYGGGYNLTWTRDEFINGAGAVQGFIKKVSDEGLVEKVLNEKLESVEIWKQMVELSKQIHAKDESLNELLHTTTEYGRIKYDIHAQSWIVMLLGYSGDKNGTYDKEKIRAAIARYDELWKEWKALEKNSPSCATIDQPNGFAIRGHLDIFGNPETGIGATIDKYRKI
jgi:alpha-L-fucosidase